MKRNMVIAGEMARRYLLLCVLLELVSFKPDFGTAGAFKASGKSTPVNSNFSFKDGHHSLESMAVSAHSEEPVVTNASSSDLASTTESAVSETEQTAHLENSKSLKATGGALGGSQSSPASATLPQTSNSESIDKVVSDQGPEYTNTRSLDTVSSTKLYVADNLVNVFMASDRYSRHQEAAADNIRTSAHAPTEDIVQNAIFIHPENCSQQEPALDIEDEGRVLFAGHRCMLAALALVCHWTVTTRTGRYLTVHMEKLEFDYPCRSGGLEIYDGSHRGRLLAWFCGGDRVRPLRHSTSNALYFVLLLKPYVHYPAFNITVVSTTEPRYPTLTVNYTSDDAGYVTSPGYNGMTEYDGNMHTDYVLSVPEGYVLLLTSPHFSVEYDSIGLCRFDYFSIYSVENDGNRFINRYCGDDFPPQIYNTSVLMLFHSDYDYMRLGFKLLFSLHSFNLAPKITENGLFNCSSDAIYSTIRQHIECNYVTECEAGEDEALCLLTSGNCDTTLGWPSCYRYVRGSEGLTWNGAAMMCRQHGSHLATMKTVHHIDALIYIISKGKRVTNVYFGLTTIENSLPVFYGQPWQWSDGTVAYLASRGNRARNTKLCSKIEVTHVHLAKFNLIDCEDQTEVRDVICESDLPQAEKEKETRGIPVHTNSDLWNDPCYDHLWKMVRCTDGHVTYDFLLCSSSEDVCRHDTAPTCGVSNTNVTLFKCDNSMHTVPYTLVCNFRADCADGSDETFCIHRQCTEDETACENGQCIGKRQRCDSRQNCADRSDEGIERCQYAHLKDITRIPPPAVIHFDGYGDFTQEALNDSRQCPETHFLCPDSYCLPVYLRCNQVYDCPGWEDEADCSTYACPGYYRCRHSAVCLHADHVCDGVFQCPQQDDELLCGLSCPEGCQCQGLAFVCATPFPVDERRHVRYVDASGSGLTPDHFVHSHYLIYLRLSRCFLDSVGEMKLPNLQTLDLSHNKIETLIIEDIYKLANLQHLILSNNPLSSIRAQTTSGILYSNLGSFDASHTSFSQISKETFSIFPHLKVLNLSCSTAETLLPGSFNTTSKLEILDIRGILADIVPEAEFRDLVHLSKVHADNFKLCCSDHFPKGFDMQNCIAPTDAVSSCTNLLRSAIFRAGVWTLAIMALLGNAANLLLRITTQERSGEKCSNSVFLVNLSVSDFITGLHLGTIGVAGQLFKGTYMWYDTEWRSSLVCRLSGFFFFTSRHVSTLTICLIVLNQILALTISHEGPRLQRKSAGKACVAVWLVGFVLNAIPFLPLAAGWQYYSRTGMCVPLPVTLSHDFQGIDYFFGVTVLFSTAFCSSAIMGVFFLLWSVKRKPDPQSLAPRNQVADVTEPPLVMMMPALSCWIVADCLALMALRGVNIPEQLNAATYTLMCSLNSVSDPLVSIYILAKNAKYRPGYFWGFLHSCWPPKCTR